MADPPAPPPGAAPAPAARRRLTLAFACLAAFITGVDQTVVTIALPAIQRELGASSAELQFVVIGYSLVFAALMIVGGTIGDRYGRKRTFLAGMTVFTLGSAIAALAPTIGVLIAGRLVSGLGAAFMVPTTLALIASVYGKSERGRAIGIWAAAAGSAVAFGPIVGGALVDALGWEAVFWINVPIGIATVVAGLVTLTETRTGEDRAGRLDVLGVLLLVPGLFALTYAVSSAGDLDGGDPRQIASIAAAVVLLAGFVIRERRAAAPMLRLSLFRRRAFVGPVVSLTLMYFAMVGVLVYLSLYYQGVQGYSALTAALFFLPTTVVVVLCAPFAGDLADKIGPRRFGVAGLLCVAGSLAVLVGLEVDTPVWILLLSQLLLGLGVGIADPPLSATILNAVPTEDAGVASATEGSTEELGSSFGVAVFGGLLAAFSTTAFADAVRDTTLDAGERAQAIADFVPLRLDAPPAAGSPDLTAELARAAERAFATGLGDTALVGALIVLGAALVALLSVPRSTVEDDAGGDDVPAHPHHPHHVRRILHHARVAHLSGHRR